MQVIQIAKSVIVAAILVSLAICLGPRQAAQAADPVILTIDGKTAGGKAIEMTRKDIEALGPVKIATTTPWDDGVVTFEGVSMKQLLIKAGAQGATVTATALDNYVTEIPVSDFDTYQVILAVKRNGQYMEVRDKGPLFIVYPYDSDPGLKSEKYYARSAWQLRTLTIK